MYQRVDQFSGGNSRYWLSEKDIGITISVGVTSRIMVMMAKMYSQSRWPWVTCVSDAGLRNHPIISMSSRRDLLQSQETRRDPKHRDRQHQQHDTKGTGRAPVHEKLDVGDDLHRHHDHLAAAQHRRGHEKPKTQHEDHQRA